MSMRDNIPKMPMIYWGSKRRVVTTVWRAFGNIAQIIEPFAGSAAVSLAHPPEWDGIIILNDADGLLVNALRALVHKPDETAYWADWPQTESDLHARHIWLVGQRDRLTSRLEGDPTWCDPQAAGWWLWGTAVWLGGRWCSGDGPWHAIDGQLVHDPNHSQLGIQRRRMEIRIQGVNAYQRDKRTFPPDGQRLRPWIHDIAQRLARSQIHAGDWTRILVDRVIYDRQPTGIFIDPPYSPELRDIGIYTKGDTDVDLAANTRAWALDHGHDPRLRIVLAGYADEHDELLDHGWKRHQWSSSGGYNSTSRSDGAQVRRHYEGLWLSPHCVAVDQPRLFEALPPVAVPGPDNPSGGSDTTI